MRPKRPEGKILFCYTVVKEFKLPYEVEGFREFLDDLKHEGATAEALEDLTNKRVAYWTDDNECESSSHAVEIIHRPHETNS